MTSSLRLGAAAASALVATACGPSPEQRSASSVEASFVLATDTVGCTRDGHEAYWRRNIIVTMQVGDETQALRLKRDVEDLYRDTYRDPLDEGFSRAVRAMGMQDFERGQSEYEQTGVMPRLPIVLFMQEELDGLNSSFSDAVRARFTDVQSVSTQTVTFTFSDAPSMRCQTI